MRPFLKWAGNKYRIVDRIKSALPNGKRLVEPFVGSGALFMNSDYSDYLLADVNADLISLFQILQAEGASFIDYCQTFFTPEQNDKERFYEYRERFNATTDLVEKGALFLYLNKHGFNGLCRYNQSGKFNVPFGTYVKPYFPRKEMCFFYEKAQNATFVCADFEMVLGEMTQVGDVVYCDPPYVPLSETANFTSYSAGKFNLTQQKALAGLGEELGNAGIPTLISNHNTRFTRQIYANAKLKRFSVQRYISCDGANRNKAKELLAIYGGK